MKIQVWGRRFGKTAALARALAFAGGATAAMQTSNMTPEEIAARDRAEGRGVSRQERRQQERLQAKGRGAC